jgi:hypothetical protein
MNRASGIKPGIDPAKKIPDERFQRPWLPLIQMDAVVEAKVGQLEL